MREHSKYLYINNLSFDPDAHRGSRQVIEPDPPEAEKRVG